MQQLNSYPQYHILNKFILKNKMQTMIEEEGVPRLVYISREKRPKHLHHFKAGAMNVLVHLKFKLRATYFGLYTLNEIIIENAFLCFM